MKFLIHISLVIPALMLAIGCGNNAEEQKRIDKAERDSLRRMDSIALKVGVLPTEECLPIVVAEKLRLYDTLGVMVHLRHYNAMSECRVALTESIVEGAVIDTVLMAELNSTSSWLYEGMRMPMTWKFLTAKKARINRFEQLGDKMIAADSHGITHKLAEQVLDTLKPKKQQAFIIQVEGLKVRTDMLCSGNVDAALLPEPYATQAQKAGARMLDMKMKGSNNGMAGVVAFRKDGMKSNERKKQLALFLKAIDIANDSIRKYGKERYMKQ